MDLLERILVSFREVYSSVHCNGDFFNLPTYWHVDGVPFLIRRFRGGILLESHGVFIKNMIISEDLSKEEIISKIYKNFVY